MNKKRADKLNQTLRHTKPNLDAISKNDLAWLQSLEMFDLKALFDPKDMCTVEVYNDDDAQRADDLCRKLNPAKKNPVLIFILPG